MRGLLNIITSVKKMQAYSERVRRRGKTISFVPTMGYLHDGHLRLLQEGRKRGDVLVMSIFVNPTQFGPKEDYAQYPRDMKRDLGYARRAGVDVVFAPTVDEMYPDGFQTSITVAEVTKTLCGPFRPGHFQGVATVVVKLFNIVKPHVALFGEKDFQQLVVIRRMVRDVDMDIEIIGVPTVREKDGLAMSSRNKYLNGEERRAALCLYRSLMKAKQLVQSGERDSKRILREVHSIIKAEPLAKIEYVSLVDQKTMKEVRRIGKKALLAMAVRIGSTRLIDNFCLP